MRSQTFAAWWVDEDGNDLAKIDLGERASGRMVWNSNADLKIGGSLVVWDVPEWVQPLRHRVRVEATINSETMPLGMYMIDMEDHAYRQRRGRHEITLLDQLQSPQQTKLIAPYAVGKGANIVQTAVNVLAACGETRVAVTPSTATLSAPLVWEPATSRLQVINDLLAAAGYWGLRTDASGYFVFAPYVLPENRPVVREFVAGEDSLMLPDYSKTNAYSGIPNRFIAVAPEYDAQDNAGENVFTGLIGVATLMNNDSLFSYENRGNRWVDESEQVEAATQKEIDSIAQQKLAALINPSVTVNVEHALFPGLWLDQAIRVVPSNGAPYVATVTEMSFPLKANGLVSGGWREVVALA